MTRIFCHTFKIEFWILKYLNNTYLKKHFKIKVNQFSWRPFVTFLNVLVDPSQIGTHSSVDSKLSFEQNFKIGLFKFNNNIDLKKAISLKIIIWLPRIVSNSALIPIWRDSDHNHSSWSSQCVKYVNTTAWIALTSVFAASQ